MNRYYVTATLVLLSLIGTQSKGQVGEWWFWPKYMLGQKASNYPGNRIDAPQTVYEAIGSETTPILFYGQEPTERISGFIEVSRLPPAEFSAELWIVNHVNQPVGVLATLKEKYSTGEPSWLLGIYDREIIYSLKTDDSHFASLLRYNVKQRGWKNYWGHVVATYDGTSMKLYLNGSLISETTAGKRRPYNNGDMELEVAAYMKNEPYMDAGNMVKMMRVYDRAIDHQEVNAKYASLKDMVTTGKLFPDLFHFTAGPYLNNATPTAMSIVWETDRPADFVIEYGKTAAMDQRMQVQSQKISREVSVPESLIQHVTLQGLEPGTNYFYNVRAATPDGQSMQSGVLTFSTAVTTTDSYSFAVIGDTEARPHVNDRVAKMVWDERPNFVVVVGDLTDGGKKDHKFEWNYEYFQGIGQLASRVPVFPVPGNGEDDLYWYAKYHSLPSSEGFYSFRYGNAEFFMLNSNKPEDFSPGGIQYQWLEENLKQSTAKWKFVAHHHAPYSADDDDYGDSWKGSSNLGDPAIRKIVPLYEKYHVDMVFFGHLHTYQRTLPIRDGKVSNNNGVIYVQGGGGGGNLEDFAPSRAWFSAKTFRGHHYFIITVNDGELNLKMYDTDGRLKDYLDLRK